MDSVGMLAFFAQTWMILSDATCTTFSFAAQIWAHRRNSTTTVTLCSFMHSANPRLHHRRICHNRVTKLYHLHATGTIGHSPRQCRHFSIFHSKSLRDNIASRRASASFLGFMFSSAPMTPPVPVSISACLATAVDVLIPVALVWQLHAIGPVCLERSYGRRLINAISAGCLGGVLSIILIILFWTQRNVYAGAVFPLGGVHCITVLVNLVVCKRRSTMVGFPPAPKSPELDVEIVLESAPGKRSISPRIVDTFVSRQAFFVDVERKSTQDTKIGYGESLEGTFSPVAL
ncbi:uncharacterized protein LACBIDRAFT_297505 [Laccaria bicolor S238N-H82]|uniref:Predicted protein n=1 Tax=Laccaria bicolor (strain S238N-H82 / ATCC MYA-4686) TaxID=486041 RepID=B0DBC4_LACBS|nr:uncharacterized protein LACBIDRAFT_297505 [Laccaria bicolor S238N-H82]EDR07967.1 predicted protein [Laccaria bicolor S238N-H82]|eukprot:XP_001881037.1 predicted protein [Laccaria bicolor S238N-H82]